MAIFRRGRVDQVAGQVDGLADDLGATECLIEGLSVIVRDVRINNQTQRRQMRVVPSAFRSPGPRVPAIAPSIKADATPGRSSEGGNATATLSRRLPASRLARAKPAEKAAPGSNRPRGPRPTSKTPRLEAGYLVKCRELPQGTSEVLLRDEASDFRLQVRPPHHRGRLPFILKDAHHEPLCLHQADRLRESRDIHRDRAVSSDEAGSGGAGPTSISNASRAYEAAL